MSHEWTPIGGQGSGRTPSYTLTSMAAAAFRDHRIRPSVCVFMCRLRSLAREKAESQRLHLKGFSPEWIRLCRFRLLNSAKLALHSEHWKGRSPVCVRMCERRLKSREKR